MTHLSPSKTFLNEIAVSTHKKKSQKICTVKKIAVILHRFSKKWRAHSSGCSSVRLEYASGGRGVASSNLVIPTEKKER